MNKRIISAIMILLLLSCSLFGCAEDKDEFTDSPIIKNGVFNIGLLLCKDSTCKETSELTESGFDFAHSLADSVNIGETVSVNTVKAYYTSNDDISSAIDTLVSANCSAVVFDGSSQECADALSGTLSESQIPVISLNSINGSGNNFYKLTISEKYMSSCAATYALENNYNKCAVLLHSSNAHYQSFADTYKSTLKSYVDVEPTVYYIDGELANYTPAALVSGGYDYVFLISPEANREEDVNNLRQAGFTGEIMLTEVFDKASMKNDVYNNCSFISKLEADSSNNISTVFLSSYSEHSGINEKDVSSASAYGYDAYLTVFEALKSFAPKGASPLSGVKNTTSPSSEASSKELKISDLSEALNKVTYYGVTDKITFTDNSVVPTYVYVNNVVNSEVIFGNKYVFTAGLNSAEQ